MPKQGMLPKLYLAWCVAVYSITFFEDKFSNDNITHLLIFVILALSVTFFRSLHPKSPRRFFIGAGVILAALVEGAYMISSPVLPSLLVSRNASPGLFLHHYAVDLALTVPVYFLIFWVMWRLINRFNYSIWGYTIVMAFGQAIGDGSSFFIAKPGALLFIPYVMLNYHAMNVAPFLSIRSSLRDTPRSDSQWKYPIAVAALFIAYFVGGSIIKITAKIVHLV